MRADRYSRMVAWLKVLLPLAALSILSTLFLLSRTINPEQSIPFADKEIQDRMRNQQITGPFFSGTTANGDQISISAKTLTTPNGVSGKNRAQDITLSAIRTSGLRLSVRAANAAVDIADNLAFLEGDVRLETSRGFKAQTARLISRLSSLDLTAPETVTASGPLGQLSAGTMTLSAPNGQSSAQLLFTGGVKLVYRPNDY